MKAKSQATTKTSIKKDKVDWKALYTDLPEKLAGLLRDARVKPEQLVKKTDGDLMSIEGLTEMDLETIRAKYKSELTEEAKPKEEKVSQVKTTNPTSKRGRSNHYKSLKKALKDSSLDVSHAVAKLQSLAKKDNSLELHLNTHDIGLRGEIKLPYGTGKKLAIEIFTDKTITALNDNKISFDILLASPKDMPKLARYAKLLGPRGLMPNPKNGTVIENPEERAKQLSEGSTISYKTEAKFPIIHLSIGKLSQKTEELVANTTAILKEIGTSKIRTAYLAATQSPSVKLDLSTL